jgi:cholesterol transport system auxiliary component
VSRHYRGVWVLLILSSTGCSFLPQKQPTPAAYDFGPAPALRNDIRPFAVDIESVSAPAWLDSNSIEYRLAYQDEFRRQPYRDSRWVAAPAVLIRQRLAERVARPDISVITATPPILLRLELNEFVQIFDTPTTSQVTIQLRAIVENSTAPTMTHERNFIVVRAAPTPDSAGAIRAFALAVDDVVGQALSWCASFAASESR